MKHLILIVNALFLSSLALADNLTAKDIQQRLEVHADIYMTDASGEHILDGPERTNYWKTDPEKGTIDGAWSSRFNAGLIAMQQSWAVQQDGSIHIMMEEFAQEKNRTFAQSLEKKEFTLKNLEPIVWKVKNIKDKNFIVRFIPSLSEITIPTNVDNLPVSGSKMTISDNNGYLWADDVDCSGIYTGVKSHRGLLILSYRQFKGSREMGAAEGNHITLNVDKKFKIILTSATSFLPAGMVAKVYAYYDPSKKTKGFNSLNSFDSSKEESIHGMMNK